MARYKDNHKPKTRVRILGAAGKVFRRQGYVAASIDEVMNAAGLTKGGFYSHFGSKKKMFTHSLRHLCNRQKRIVAEVLGDLTGVARVEKLIRVYLSPEHLARDTAACPLPCLLSEMRRADEASRRTIEDFYRWAVETIAGHLEQAAGNRERATKVASGLVSTAVGAITIARACPTEEQSCETLGQARSTCFALLDSLPGIAEKMPDERIEPYRPPTPRFSKADFSRADQTTAASASAPVADSAPGGLPTGQTIGQTTQPQNGHAASAAYGEASVHRLPSPPQLEGSSDGRGGSSVLDSLDRQSAPAGRPPN